MDIENLKETNQVAKYCLKLVISYGHTVDEVGQNLFIDINDDDWTTALQEAGDNLLTKIRITKDFICNAIYPTKTVSGCGRIANCYHGLAREIVEDLRDKMHGKNPYKKSDIRDLFAPLYAEFKTATKALSDIKKRPKNYLTSWREILIALGKTNNNEDREEVRNFNSKHDGPILIPKQGAQPKVEKTKLIEWWNNLEAQWETGYSRQRDAKPTISNLHDYGRNGVVNPDISGGVKARRKDRKR